VAEVIGYNRFYLSFNRILNPTLREQLQSLCNMSSSVSLDPSEDLILWRLSASGLFSTHSYYNWLEYGGMLHPQYTTIWTTFIPLKIKIFLRLVQKNKIRKYNLRHKSWQGEDEIVDHLFLHCSIYICLWR
jgi:zinc-binding in reverse transcriptase